MDTIHPLDIPPRHAAIHHSPFTFHPHKKKSTARQLIYNFNDNDRTRRLQRHSNTIHPPSSIRFRHPLPSMTAYDGKRVVERSAAAAPSGREKSFFIRHSLVIIHHSPHHSFIITSKVRIKTNLRIELLNPSGLGYYRQSALSPTSTIKPLLLLPSSLSLPPWEKRW